MNEPDVGFQGDLDVALNGTGAECAEKHLTGIPVDFEQRLGGVEGDKARDRGFHKDVWRKGSSEAKPL